MMSSVRPWHEGEVTALTTCPAPGPGGAAAADDADDAGVGAPAFFVSGGADGTARVWDPRAAREVCVLTGHRRRVYSLAAGPRGVVYAGDFSDAVKARYVPVSSLPFIHAFIHKRHTSLSFSSRRRRRRSHRRCRGRRLSSPVFHLSQATC